jgi:hypothetical protein
MNTQNRLFLSTHHMMLEMIGDRGNNMKTDWHLIRELMISVIDACEAIEELNLTESDRDALLESAPANVWDALQSAWTYPENVQYAVIRTRHQLGNNKSYTPEAARALVNAAKVCAELVAAGESEPIQDPVRKLTQWYAAHLVPQVTKAIETKHKTSAA